MGCWSIWTPTNDKIFKGVRPSVNSWCHLLKQDLQILCCKIKEKCLDGLRDWMDVPCPSLVSSFDSLLMLGKIGVR